jgi:hypothetical protein
MFKLKSITKGLSSVRSVLSKAPSISSFAFPPQIQAGIKVANMIGINVPSSPSALLQGVLKRDVDKDIAALQKLTLNTVDDIESTVTTNIEKIDWLL